MSLTREISITWRIEDVLKVRPELTELEASSVLECMQDGHDAMVDLNWDVIDIIADDLLYESAKTEQRNDT